MNYLAVKNELFGCEDWKELKPLTGYQREQRIVDVYRTKLKEIADFVFPYRICFPDKKRTYYYLFHLSKHYMESIPLLVEIR